VLVCPERVVPRFADLTKEEVADLYTSVQTVGKVIEKVYNGTSLSIVLQVRNKTKGNGMADAV